MISSNPIFLSLVTPGIIFSVLGWILFKFPPKNINGLYRYRTGSSMQNQERWDFAQTYSGKQMIWSGVIMILIGVIGAWFFNDDDISVILSLAVLVIIIITLIMRVELALKKKFDS